MGKIKLDARNIMLGKNFEVFAVFVMSIIILMISGNAPILLERLLKQIENQEYAVRIALQIMGVCVCIILYVLIAAPLRFGREYRFYLLANGRTACAKTLFHFFAPHRVIKSVGAWLLYTSVRAVRFFMFQIPTIAAALALWYITTGKLRYVAPCAALAVCIAVLFFSGCMFSLIYGGGELLYFNILFEYPNIKALHAIRISRRIAEKSVFSIARFKLSFAAWVSLCIFIFPCFYVWNYYKQSLAVLSLKNMQQNVP